MAKKKRVVDPERATQRLMRQQLKAFRRKFGRDPLPGEPVFFDPDEDVPTEISDETVRAETLEFLSDLPPQFAYAYAKTGLLLLLEEQQDNYPPEAIAEWKAAIDEYFELEEKGTKQ